MEKLIGLVKQSVGLILHGLGNLIGGHSGIAASNCSRVQFAVWVKQISIC
jgi:hypothetical protein